MKAIYFFVVLLCIVTIVIPPGIYAQTDPSPTLFYCLGNTSCGDSPTSTMPPTISPQQNNSNVTYSPTTDPCNVAVSVSDRATVTAKRGAVHMKQQGMISSFFQFFLRLIQYILSLLSGGNLPTPSISFPPKPSVSPIPSVSVSNIPSRGISQRPCPSLATDPFTQLPSVTVSPRNVSVTPVAPSQVPAHTRDPFKQPFASTSIWNMPIGSGAVYVPANLPSNPGTDASTRVPQIDDEHIVLRPDAPMTSIQYSDAGWSGSNRCTPNGGSTQGLPVSVPIPADYTVPNNGENGSSAFLMPDKRTIIQTQPFTRCSAGGVATSIVGFAAEDVYGDGITGAHGGSNLSAIGGSIRVGELRPGQIGMRHALKINVYAARVLYPCTVRTDCYRWPAKTADGYAIGNYGTKNPTPLKALRMGSLLAIPASVALGSLGLESEPGKQIAWTLQNYGAYIVDDTWSAAYALNAEDGPDGSLREQFQSDYGYPFQQLISDNTSWTRDLQRIVKVLAVVDNNSPTSIGGGGTPLQPLAPPIAP